MLTTIRYLNKEKNKKYSNAKKTLVLHGYDVTPT